MKLEAGNVFTGVFLSTGGVCLQVGSLHPRVLHRGEGGLPTGGGAEALWSASWGVGWVDPPPKNWKSGQYTSCWNALLLEVSEHLHVVNLTQGEIQHEPPRDIF